MYGDAVARDSTVFCDGWQWLKIVSAYTSEGRQARRDTVGLESGLWRWRGEECCLVTCAIVPTGIAVVVKVYLQRFALGFLAFVSGESLVAFLEHGVKVSFQG